MKDKKLEANLSMIASRVMAGLNMNALKFLLPFVAGCVDGCHYAMYICGSDVLDNRLVCKGSTCYKAAADETVLSWSFWIVWVYVLLSVGYQ